MCQSRKVKNLIEGRLLDPLYSHTRNSFETKLELSLLMTFETRFWVFTIYYTGKF